MSRAEEIRSFILSYVREHPKDIVLVTMNKFSVSHMTVHRHINHLIKKNLITKTGKTQATSYYLQDSFLKRKEFSKSQILHEDQIWSEHFSGTFKKLNKNIYDICYYGFTEIFNNAIDHSSGQKISVKIDKKHDIVVLSIFDDGIGAFKKIAQHLNLSDVREATFQLSKGKLTTDPKNHTGEGIFFSSRAFDDFKLYANGILYGKNNQEKDWYLEDWPETQQKGTLVKMSISEKSLTQLEEVFRSFQNEDTLAFDRTHILVKLSLFKEDNFISRSQAKRILQGLDKFGKVTLDFADVRGVGQGFVDEIFRIFKNRHPEIQITPINTNKSVEMMIERSFSTQNL